MAEGCQITEDWLYLSDSDSEFEGNFKSRTQSVVKSKRAKKDINEDAWQQAMSRQKVDDFSKFKFCQILTRTHIKQGDIEIMRDDIWVDR